MFKRANKITSLLVAAASIMSIVPAYAADVTKVDSQDGTIYNAVAYADGKAYVDGEINDDEEAYYEADGQQTALEDVNSGDEATLFGEKYLNVSDGDYTVDLSDGTVTDDDIVSDTADDAAAALRKKIKDDTEDRYDENLSDDVKDESDLTLIPGGKYAKVWYATTYNQASKSTANNHDTTGGAALAVVTDTDGNYIDADYSLGKIKVKTTDNAGVATTPYSSKEVTVENTNDTYDSATTKDAVTVTVTPINGDGFVGQDADYIYRIVNVNVKADTNITKINGVDLVKAAAAGNSIFTDGIGGAAGTGDGTTPAVEFPAVQKISKAQASGDVDGAKYAKTVTTYALSDEDGQALSNEALVTASTTKFTLVNGKFIAYDDTTTNGKVVVNAYTLKASSGYYYADEEDQSKEDAENSTDQGNAVQTDVDGNLWRLDGGYIYKFNNVDDWDKVYKVDGSFDEFSVYNEDNIVAWSESDEVYSMIGSQKATDTTTTGTAVTVTTAGWVQAADGTWSYNKADGTKATGWLNLNGTWYFLKADGVMATGWVQDGGTWYYLQSSGAMATGWLNDNGTWYYLNASGAMLANTTVDGYVLGANGAWVK